MERRLQNLREKMKKEKLDAILIYNFEGSNRATTWYLSGFSGSFAVLFITFDGEYVITDSRYFTQVQEQSDFELIPYTDGKEQLKKTLSDLFRTNKVSRIGFESERITYNQFQEYVENLNSEKIEIDEIIKNMRSVKTDEEIKKIKKAVKVAEESLESSLEYIKQGNTENEIAARINYEIYKRGGKPSFETIVVSGKRSALVHGMPSDKKVENGEFVLIDYGAMVDGYCSDITRTFLVGEATPRMEKVYKIVQTAQKKAREAAKAGLRGVELHNVAKKIIEDEGFGEYFGHGLGHGLGMEVHESPGVSTRNEDPLPENAVITIEPGIYIPNEFGVRIEDDVVIKKGYCEVLTSLDRNLKSL
ncbi:MAG: Xaa-Pro peptidase family protein [Thermotogota bacterium]|nr:Xaa-Pro peptidase family protein [Thermotogota bacterium]